MIASVKGWSGTRDSYSRNPVALATLEALSGAFAVEVGPRPRQRGRVDAFECVHVDDCVQAIIDFAGHERHCATAGANVELGGACPKSVFRDERRITNFGDEFRVSMGGP